MENETCLQFGQEDQGHLWFYLEKKIQLLRQSANIGVEGEKIKGKNRHTGIVSCGGWDIASKTFLYALELI